MVFPCRISQRRSWIKAFILAARHVVRLQLLPVQLDRLLHVARRQRLDRFPQPRRHLRPLPQRRLDQQPCASHRRIVDLVAVLRVQDVGQQVPHLGRRKELARAAPPLGKLAQHVLVGAPDHVPLDVAEPQPLLVQDVHQPRQRVVVQHALVPLRRIEVAAVDHAQQLRVLAGDAAQVVGDLLAQPLHPAPDRAPACVVRQIKAHQVAVRLHKQLRRPVVHPQRPAHPR